LLIQIGRERLKPDKNRRRNQRGTKRQSSLKHPVRRAPPQDISHLRPIILRRQPP
jgi:hypothetical protein